MRTKLIYGLGFAAIVSSGLAAQTQVVFPPQFEKIEASGSSSSYSYGSPFYSTSSASYRSYRFMQVMDLDSKTKGKIASLAFRRDGMRNAGKMVTNVQTELELAFSTSKNGSAALSKTFASNIGADAVTVIAKKKLNIAAIPFLGTSPEPFFVRIPFDSGKQFSYDASKGSLLMDMRVYDNNMYDATTKTYKYLDLDLASISTYGSTVSYGDGCSYDFYSYPMSYYGSVSVDSAKGNLKLYGSASNGVPGQPLVWLSTVNGMSKAGAKLPTGCSLYLDLTKLMAMNVALADSRGSARWPTTGYMEFPYNKDYAGLNIDSQALSINVASGQIYSSNFHRAVVPYWEANKKLATARVYKAGTTAQTDADGYGPYVGYSQVMTMTLK